MTANPRDGQNPWLQWSQQALQQWTQAVQTTLQGVPQPAGGAGAVPGSGDAAGLSQVLQRLSGQPVQLDPRAWLEIQQDYLRELGELWRQGLQVQPPRDDRRFAADAWARNPVAAYSAAWYLLNARTLMRMADAVQADPKTRARVRFAVQQWIDASAPSNFLALNAEAQQKALETQGESIAKGVQNLLHDMKQGFVSMTDHSAFEVGRNVATTEGQVVFENELFQLIEYKPLTPKVHERPFLVVPPCINKYYILDLQPDNSFLRYAVEQGHRTFVMSWRNPDAELAQATWDDYIENAVIRAIDVVREIGKADTVNALGFCVGGTMLGTALAVLAARGERKVESVTFLTTLLDFTDTGVLDVFIDEAFVQLRELQFANGGILPGRELATTFSFLRPNDLVWNYVVGNYLKGETPPPFDLLYWNSDSTNLPGRYYAWYLRHLYLQNELCQPGTLTVCGERIDLGAIDIPAYVYGSREDHIVPIGGAYATTQHLGGPVRFVMGASGHIAGVINPAAKGKRSYWTGAPNHFPPAVDDWIDAATEHKGSWWTDWAPWLAAHAGPQVAAPRSYGNRRHKPIEPAPGRYVRVSAQEALATLAAGGRSV
ncbi:Poly(3-hydroxyalkanoate) polymerase subunit PhaC [Tepidimonas thermarum]|uniref:Poly(3-hydroxyalkanoate) polymerase subunit PhaC n=1 Tax=Tepidimonas thermarum TaxID=335431 RepID=A0A554X158_9BURK|nr:class I poly(R)-hydroxyalkanoic acid synthase [Tepidimonas thermarum]TSE29579.1 Poly(3-hydroxyalkanoate) polymerase subunit PhaC [Tepidimonas thermarum]